MIAKNHEKQTSRNAYIIKALDSFFDVKGQRKLDHINDLIYLLNFPKETGWENYLGEPARRTNEKVLEHPGKDK